MITVILLLIVALNPLTVEMFFGLDGPGRVLLVVLALLLSCSKNCLQAVRLPSHYVEIFYVFSFVLLVFAALVNSFLKYGINLSAVSNMLSIMMLLIISQILDEESLNKFIVSLCYGLLLGGVIVSFYVFYEAVIYDRFFIGLLRYDGPEANNYNHLASYLGLVIVVLFIARNNYINFGLLSAVLFFLTIVAFVLLVSKTSILALSLSLIAYRFRSRYIVITLVSLSVAVLLALFFLNIDKIYIEYHQIADSLTTGRARLWYHASNKGMFELISSLYEWDSIFLERQMDSDHHTSYLHSSILYFLLHMGIVSMLLVSMMFIYVLYKTFRYNKKSDVLLMIALLYIVLLGIGEMSIQFQKYGSIFYFTLFYLLTSKRYIRNCLVYKFTTR